MLTLPVDAKAASQGRPSETDAMDDRAWRMLLDDYLPAFDARTRHTTGIAASAERVYATLRTVDFDQWGLARRLDALRVLPAFPAAPRATWHRVRAHLGRPGFTLAD